MASTDPIRYGDAAGGALQGTYPNPDIQDGYIQTRHISVGTITNELIATGAITRDKFSFTIDLSEIIAVPENITSGVITAAHLADIITYVRTQGNQNLSGIKSFERALQYRWPTIPADMTNKHYVDSMILSGTGSNPYLEPYISGIGMLAILNQGNIVYLTNYASGTKTLLNVVQINQTATANTLSGVVIDTREIESYASGVEAMRRVMTSANPQLEAFASGINTTVNIIQTNLTSNTNTLSGVITDLQELTEYASGLGARPSGGGSNTATGSSIRQTYAQTHDFSALNAIYRTTGEQWAKAKADNLVTAESVGIIESVSGNQFTVVFEGEIENQTGLLAGFTYFLSASNAGEITPTEPVTSGTISKPVMNAISDTKGIVVSYRGVLNGVSGSSTGSDCTEVIAYASGIETMRRAMVLAGDATAVTTYASGINGQLISFQNETTTNIQNLTQYTSGNSALTIINQTNITNLTTSLSGVQEQISDFQSAQSTFNTNIESYASGIETLRQAMVLGGDVTQVTNYASGINGQLINIQNEQTTTNILLSNTISGVNDQVVLVQNDLTSNTNTTSGIITDLQELTDYASGIETLRQAMVLGGDVVNITNYASGINGQLILVQNHLNEVESYASGTAGTGSGSNPLLENYTSGINNQFIIFQNNETEVNNTLSNNLSGVNNTVSTLQIIQNSTNNTFSGIIIDIAHIESHTSGINAQLVNIQNSIVTIENNGTPIGTKPTLNFIPGPGIIFNFADDGTKLNLKISGTGTSGGTDTSYIENYASGVNGQLILVQNNLTSNNNTTSGINSSLILINSYASGIESMRQAMVLTGGDTTELTAYASGINNTVNTIQTKQTSIDNTVSGLTTDVREIESYCSGNKVLLLNHADQHREGATDDLGVVPFSGFVNRTSSNFVLSGYAIQIVPNTEFVFYTNGHRFVKTTTQQIAITEQNKQHYVYFDANGEIQVSTTMWALSSSNIAPCTVIYRDNLNFAVGDERHSYQRIPAIHEAIHDGFGTAYNFGFGASFGNSTFLIDSGEIHDEDLEFDISAQTACRLWHRNSDVSAMTIVSGSTTTPYATTGTLQWDNNGTLTNIGVSKFVCNYVYATDDIHYPIYIIVGQAEHNTIARARNDNLPTTPEIYTREWKLLYRVIYQNSGGTPTYVEALDLRRVNSGPGSSYTPASHTDLTNRDAENSHPITAITELNSYLSGTKTLVNLNQSNIANLESFTSGINTLTNVNQSDVSRLEPLLSGIQSVPFFVDNRELTHIVPNAIMLNWQAGIFYTTIDYWEGYNNLYTINLQPQVIEYWSGTKTLANINQSNITNLTSYASGIETLRQSMTTGGDTTELTSYASGINTFTQQLAPRTSSFWMSNRSATEITGGLGLSFNSNDFDTEVDSNPDLLDNYQYSLNTKYASSISGVNSNLVNTQNRVTVLEGSSGGNATKQIITHDDVFETLNAVYKDSSNVWQKSKADTLNNSEVVGVVESTSGNSSTIVMGGVIANNLITAGLVYYLSDVTDGALQTSEATNISKPVMIGIDSGIGIVQIFRSLVTSGITTNPPDVPTGTIIPYGGSSAPSGYLLCDGTAYDRATYAELFAIIGISYGNGNGSSTFNVPDLRGRTVVGSGTGAGESRTSSGVPIGTALTSRAKGDYFGEETHVLTVAELAEHSHSVLAYIAGAGYTTLNAAIGTNTNVAGGAVVNTGSNAAHNTMQPSMVTNFIIKATSQTGSSNITYPLPRAHLAGYGTAPYTTSGISVAAGSARSDDNEFNIITSTNIVKKLTGPFIAGSLQNGIDSGNRAASTTYHVHEITDGTNVDTLFSTSATSPTLPSGFVAARRIMSFKTNSTGFIPSYVQHGDKVVLKTPINEFAADPTDGSQQTITLSVPAGIRVIADTHWLAFNTANIAHAAVVGGDCVAFEPTGSWAYRALYENQNTGGMCELQLLTNIAGQVNYFCSATYALSSLIINTRGWIDTRGRDN